MIMITMRNYFIVCTAQKLTEASLLVILHGSQLHLFHETRDLKNIKKQKPYAEKKQSTIYGVNCLLSGMERMFYRLNGIPDSNAMTLHIHTTI